MGRVVVLTLADDEVVDCAFAVWNAPRRATTEAVMIKVFWQDIVEVP